VQPAQPTSQSCQKTNFKQTYCIINLVLDLHFYEPWMEGLANVLSAWSHGGDSFFSKALQVQNYGSNQC